MPAAEKRKLEQEQMKINRINHIIECAFGLFAENGFETITMNQIASESEIGVASLYRYFSTKEDLAIEAAIYSWKLEESLFTKVFGTSEYEALNGYKQMEALLEVFEEALVSQGAFFRFVYYFDSFIKKEKVSPDRLSRYEDVISGSKNIVISALEKGIKDGSITFSNGQNQSLAKATLSELYFSITHSLFSLAQKLSLSGEMLNMDKQVHSEKQMQLLIQMMLSSLR